jgi:adenylate kinase family enzyme
MIYLIGGCPRSGKSTLARKILREKGIAFTSLDLLAQALKKGLPELGFHTHSDFEHYVSKCDSYFPFIWPFIKTARYLDDNYIIEGCDFTPQHSRKLQELAIENGFEIKACFLGFSEVTDYELEKFGSKYSWMHGKPIDELKLSGEKFLKISEYNQKECEKLGIKYFDVSGNDLKIINLAYKFLLAS